MLPVASPSVPPRWLDDDEQRAWRGWLGMSMLLRGQILQELHAATGLSEPDFAVLVNLSEATEGRLRMTDLAAAMRWSKSRLSHQVSRMEARGLVTRQDCEVDGRATYAVLTPCGRAMIEHAAPLHVESVRRHFIDLLSPGELALLARLAERVTGHLQAVLPDGGDGVCGADEVCGADMDADADAEDCGPA